jgi:hypothetical protein
VVVVVPKAKGDELAVVVDRLKELGLDVTKVHDKLGLVTGSVERDKIDALSKVNGVSAVREEKPIRLPRRPT